MKLARFIQTRMEQLLDDWEAAAVEIAPEMEGEDSRALRDHARQMLEFIAEDLLIPQSKQESARKALGKAKSYPSAAGQGHGTGRLDQGMSILQLIQDCGRCGSGLPGPGARNSRVSPQRTWMNWCGSTRPSIS